MANLIYVTNASVDGYVEDADGRFDWGEPGEDYFRFLNEQLRAAGTFLYGRRMYETMVYWETSSVDDQPAHIRDFTEIWRGADKIVVSRTLSDPMSERTRIERDLEPDDVRRLKAEAEREIWIGGADLAGQAIRAGLVDELRLFAWPAVVGGGKRWLPHGERLGLELIDSHRLAGGVLYSRYRVDRHR